MPGPPQTLNNPEEFKRVAPDLEQFRKDTEYLDSHHSRLTEQYPDHYVIVFQETGVYAALTVEEAAKLAKGKGVPPNKAAMQLMETQHTTWILSTSLQRNAPSADTGCPRQLHASRKTSHSERPSHVPEPP